MASLFETAKKAVNKVTDELYKDKWDKSQLNLALLSDAEESAEKEKQEEKQAFKDDTGFLQTFEQQIKEHTEQKNQNKQVIAEAPVPAGSTKDLQEQKAENKPQFRSRFAPPPSMGGEPMKYGAVQRDTIPLSELPKVDPSQSISNIGKETEPHHPAIYKDMIIQKKEEEAVPVPKTEVTEPAPKPEVKIEQQNEQQNSNILQYKPRSVPKEIQEAQKKCSSNILGNNLLKNEAKVVPPAAAQPVVVPEVCYYVHITHTKTYPALGSRVMTRSCDLAYVWKDTMKESEKPDYEYCPGCGKKISHTNVEME